MITQITTLINNQLIKWSIKKITTGEKEYIYEKVIVPMK